MNLILMSYEFYSYVEVSSMNHGYWSKKYVHDLAMQLDASKDSKGKLSLIIENLKKAMHGHKVLID